MGVITRNPSPVKPEQITYLVVLRPEPHVDDPPRALKRALKVLLRHYGLRATSAEEVS